MPSISDAGSSPRERAPNSIDIPDRHIELKHEWLVLLADGYHCVWTLRDEVVALCHYAHICGGNVIEIGCNEGHTTAALAYNNPAARIYAVDWDQSPSTMVPEQRGECPQTVGRFAREFANVEIINVDSSELTYDSDWNVRMIFIDGGHHYAQVKRDTNKAIAYLQNHRGGYVLWHDYAADRPKWVEVAHYLDREIMPYYGLSVFKGTSLAVIYVGTAEEERTRVHRRLAALDYECRQVQRQLAAALQDVARLDDERGRLAAELLDLRARWSALRGAWPWMVTRPLREIDRFQRRVKRLIASTIGRSKGTQSPAIGDPTAASATASHAGEVMLGRSAQLMLRRLRHARATTHRSVGPARRR